ncbi:FAD-dependent oxidoreductase [Pararobbsia silviterrae]|uniref:Thioredoxin reductase n=1 Tax=Pararobbsia silviterrae TaxID=1792498 RepID=A0A494XDC2_9BURK|nr:FAD-dependent oxidoreductase [Pararobbsia silviterrae]RKP48640.1 thioredoxin reductase [Pararobbsia silviterrae]
MTSNSEGKPAASQAPASGAADDATAAAAPVAPVELAPVEAPFSSLNSRMHQMFPKLTDANIARMRQFGDVRHYLAGTQLLRVGQPAPGMYVVLSGAMRVVRRDALGHNESVGDKGAGHFIAEVASISGGPTLVDGFAATDLEAIMITPERLRALLIADAELSEVIMRALILRRVSLIQHGAGGPVLVGTGNEPQLTALQGFLTRNNHPHTVIDAKTDPEAAALVERVAAKPDDFPLVICPDGTVLRNPDEGRLASCLGWLPEFDESQVYDVAIVGAGPSGLAAAVYAASEGLSVAVFDCRAPGGQAGASARIENYLGFPTGISGQALAGRAFVQAQKFGAHIAIPAEIVALDCSCSAATHYQLGISLKSGQHVNTRALVVASGAVYRRPPIDNLLNFEGRGVYYWASPVEAKLCKHEEVVLVGGGNSAGQAAVYLASYVKHLHIYIRGTSLDASMSRYLIDRIAALPNVTLHPCTEIAALEGDERGLARIRYRSASLPGEQSIDARYLFLFIGADPNTEWLRHCGVALDSHGFVLTGVAARPGTETPPLTLETSVDGVFAIGDVRSGSTKRIASGVGEGAAVVAQIHGFLAKQGQLAPTTAQVVV